MHEPAFLTARCSTVAAYARDLLQSGAALPSHHGESAAIFEGCYTTQSDVKRGNRQGENALCTADTLSALAGQSYPHALRDAWLKVLFHQFHDILDGSAIHESYEHTAGDYQSVRSAAWSAIDSALPRLLPEAFAGEIAVTNPLGWDRQDVVIVPGMQGQGMVWLRDSAGNLTPGQFTAEGLCFVATVPAFCTTGYTTVRDDARPAPAPITAVPSL
jgi:alpha-mannosidase